MHRRLPGPLIFPEVPAVGRRRLLAFGRQGENLRFQWSEGGTGSNGQLFAKLSPPGSVSRAKAGTWRSPTPSRQSPSK